VDYYLLGLVAFELLSGKKAFGGRDRQEVQAAMLEERFQVGEHWSEGAKCLVRSLLRADPKKRLGGGK